MTRLAAGLLLVLASTCGAQEARVDPLWAATLTGLDDKPVAMDRFRGRPLAVNFWARWCTPCRDEIPDFVRARAKYKTKGMEVVGIAITANFSNVQYHIAPTAIRPTPGGNPGNQVQMTATHNVRWYFEPGTPITADLIKSTPFFAVGGGITFSGYFVDVP